MPTNTNGHTLPEGMGDRTLPQEFIVRDTPPAYSKKTIKALPELLEERDHVSKPGGGTATEFCLGGLLNIAIEIAAERRALLGAIKNALERRDHPEVIRLVSKLCGVNDEKSSGTNSGINGGSGG
jgi:hypothetical protein